MTAVGLVRTCSGVITVENWLTHLVTLAAGVGGGSGLAFLLKWKASTSDTYRTIIADLTARGDARELRLDNLEKRVEQIQHDHLECEKKHAKMEGKVEALEKLTNNRQ